MAETDHDNEFRIRLFNARSAVQQAWWAMDQAKEAAKEAKAEHDGKVAEMMLIIDEYRSGQQSLPFPTDSASESPTPALPSPELKRVTDWRSVTLTELGLPPKDIQALELGQFKTLGQISDFRKNGLKFTDIKGISATTAKRIQNAIDRFFLTHQVFDPGSEGGDESE